RAVTAEARLAAAVETLVALANDLTEVRAQAEETDRELAALPEPTLARGALEAARGAAVEARRRESDTRAALEGLTRDAEGRSARLSAIEIEERSWGKRGEGAAAQNAALAERRNALAQDIAGLAARPAAIAAESEALGVEMAEAAANWQRAG